MQINRWMVVLCFWPLSTALAQSDNGANTAPNLEWGWNKWSLSLQGFLESDVIWDTTQSFSDVAGNSAVARPRTYAGDHSRVMLSVRNSRLNVQLSHDGQPFRSNARIEMDFLGNQPSGISESAFFENPTPRLRHFYATFDFDHLQLLLGQTWQLLGSQPMPQVMTSLIPGTPGMLYGRAPQVRLQGKETTAHWQWSWALAASRPPARDAAIPDGQINVRLANTDRQGIHTVAAVTTESAPAMIGVAGVLRGFATPASASPTARALRTLGYGWSVDAFLPIVGDPEHRANNLSLSLSYVGGAGIADMFTGLSGGLAAVGDIDAGLVGVDGNGELRPIAWQVLLGGLQYYLPPEGCLCLALNGSYMTSSNIGAYGENAFKEAWWADLSIMADVVPQMRLGLDIASVWQRYVDGVMAKNLRVQVSAFYIF